MFNQIAGNRPHSTSERSTAAVCQKTLRQTGKLIEKLFKLGIIMEDSLT